MDIHYCRATFKKTCLFNTNILFSKTLITEQKPFFPPSSLSSYPHSHVQTHHLHLSLRDNPSKHKTLLAETSHENERLGVLIQKLNNKASSPLQTLSEDGDWSKQQFWAVIRFLKRTSRSGEILQVIFLFLFFCAFFLRLYLIYISRILLLGYLFFLISLRNYSRLCLVAEKTGKQDKILKLESTNDV